MPEVKPAGGSRTGIGVRHPARARKTQELRPSDVELIISSMRSRSTCAGPIFLGVLLIVLSVAQAQPLSGTYPVGPGGPGVDSFATVQAAASALNARGLGGNVEFPISRFIYTGPVALRSVANSRNYTTRFLPKSTGATIDAGGSRYAFSVESTHNVSVQSLRFQGARDTGSACIRFADSDSGLVWACRMVSDSVATGLLVERAVNFRLDTSRVQGTMRASGSRGLDFRDCWFTEVRKCSILGTLNTGVSIVGGGDNMTMMTGIKTASDTGFRVANSPRVSVTDCAVIGRTDNGLHVVNSPSAHFDSCLMNGTHKQGAYFESCDSLRSLALMLFGTAERGARVVRSRGCEFMRLTIQTGPKRGLVLDRSPDCLIDSLQVVNVNSDTAIGVLLDSAPNSAFRWAMLYGNYGRAFQVSRSSGSSFAHTRVHGTAANAAMAFDLCSGVKVEPCSLSGTAPVGVVLSDSCNDDTLARLTMLGATGDAISARNSRGLVVANSCVRGWTSKGIVLAGVRSPRLYYNTIVGPESSGVAGVDLSDVSGAEARDNVIWNRGLDTSACYRITGTFPFAPGASDYNDLCASGGLIARVGDTIYGGLPGWRGHASAPDAHSLSRDPLFVTGDNFHLSSASPCRDSGITIPGFPFDIDFDERDTFSPDIGADEFTPGAVSEVRPVLQPFRFELRGNPTSHGCVTVVLDGFRSSPGASALQLLVYDATGRVVLSRPVLSSSFVLRTLSFPPGVYLVRFNAGGFNRTRKFVVQR
ncbi:MAG: T9SS type A sorting domain-containing protein [candidate division WOR-3 bacterium]|nr:T9SS type A sorting domain-containing protein [candidate division WOR-3 bacterium]